jgi:regulator of protease activity HflC (stomatin/prohibitin superfamily)
MEFWWPLIIALGGIIYLVRSIKVIPDNQKRAAFILGRFIKFIEPGLRFKFSGRDTVWAPIAIGDRGELRDYDLGAFRDVQIPVSAEGEIRIGDMVRIRSFTNNQTIVVRDQDQSRYFVCEKCGHQNQINPAS